MNRSKPIFTRFREIYSNWKSQLTFFVLAFMLGYIGYFGYYWQTETHWTFFRPLFSTIKLFALVLDVSTKSSIPNVKEWVYVLLVLARCFALLCTTNILVTLTSSLIGRFFLQIGYSVWKGKASRVLIIGNNEKNISIFNSAEESDHAMIMCGMDLPCEKLKAESVRYFQTEALQKEVVQQVEKALGRRNNRLTVIINTLDEECNLNLCKAVVDIIRRLTDDDRNRHSALESSLKNNRGSWPIQKELLEIEKRIADKLERVKIVVLGDRQYQAIYQELQQESLGLLRFTNIYQMIAFDFVSEHPLTEYLKGSAADLLDDCACISKDAEFNVLFVGFGNTNQEIFLDSFATNQFIEYSDGKIPQMKPVKYHFFDKVDAHHNKNLNHTVLRYCDDFLRAEKQGKIDRTKYLPLPPIPAELEDFRIRDINDTMFYDNVREICSSNPKSINYVVIAFSNDLNNLDLAQRLAEKKEEWDLNDFHIFVKIRNKRNREITEVLSWKDYTVFGEEKDYFSLKKIMQNEIETIAFRRSFSYKSEYMRKEYEHAPLTLEEIQIHTLYDWHTMDKEKRLSNIYSILALRMKLQLMRMDYIEGKWLCDSFDPEEYLSVYAKDDPPEKLSSGEGYKGKPLYKYDRILELADFEKDILRRNLAIQEHYRWNAFMIMSGFVPAPIQQMENRNTKDYRLLRNHGCLTTFEGLFQYRQLMANVKGTDENAEDTIRWDFQLMDDAAWFLNEIEYKIIVR